MRNARVWARLLGIEHAVIEGLEYDEDEQLLVAQVRPSRSAEDVAGSAGGAAGAMTAVRGRRRWRALDLGTIRAVLEADAPRVSCPQHGGGRRGGAVGAARRRSHPRAR